jgi:uncharacterized repeat protein (TIGR01451 family)
MKALLTKLTRRGMLLATLVTAAAGASLFITSQTLAAATNGFNCDSNAVIYCGAETSKGAAAASQITSRYNSGDGHNSAASIHSIYGSSWFGIGSSDIQNLSKNAQVGTVTKSGNVIVGGKTVATNALTAGRQNLTGSTKRTSNGTVFYTRTPQVSFTQSSLSAYVVMQNGQFKFAVLESCGNPVHATPNKPTPPPTPPPAPKPNYTINKEVAVKGSNNYAKSVKVASGTHVVYRITVASTGNAPVTNLKVSDKLPADAQYVGGSLLEDGKPVDGGQFFSGGVTVSSLKNGSSTVFTFEAIIGSKDTVDTCQAESLDNVGNMIATGLPGQSSTATVSKTCAPKPVYQCTSLTPLANSRDAYTFTAKASASNGATITGYNFDFGDHTTKTVTTVAQSATAQHTYDTPGDYNVSVAAVISVAGATKTVTAPACATKITVAPAPTAECTDLKLNQDATNPRAVTATVAYNAQNGATLTGVSFDWNDGTTTPSSTQTTANHTYQKDGSFTVVATLTFSATSGTVPNSNCQAPITITTVMPTCNSLTVDINNDTKTVTVTGLDSTANNDTYLSSSLDWGDNSPVVNASAITGQAHTYTANGPFTIVATPHFLVNGVDTPITGADCQKTVSFTEAPVPPTPPTTPTPPTELINTGAGSVVGLFAAAVILGTFGYRFFLGRRLNRASEVVDKQ